MALEGTKALTTDFLPIHKKKVAQTQCVLLRRQKKSLLHFCMGLLIFFYRIGILEQATVLAEHLIWGMLLSHSLFFVCFLAMCSTRAKRQCWVIPTRWLKRYSTDYEWPVTPKKGECVWLTLKKGIVVLYIIRKNHVFLRYYPRLLTLLLSNCTQCLTAGTCHFLYEVPWMLMGRQVF